MASHCQQLSVAAIAAPGPGHGAERQPAGGAAQAFTELIVVNGAVQFDWVGWLEIGHSMDRAARVISILLLDGSSVVWGVHRL